MTALAVKAVQADSPAAAAGIQPGDMIVSVDGEPLGDPLTLDERLRDQVGSTITLTLARGMTEKQTAADPDSQADQKTIEVSLKPREVSWIEESRWPSSPVSVPTLGVALGVDSLVAFVAEESPAAAAGIKAGERVVRVRFETPAAIKQDKAADVGLEISKKSPSWPYIVSVLQQVPDGTKLQLVIESADGQQRDVSFEPVESSNQFVIDRGLIFEPLYTIVRSDSLWSALRQGGRKAFDDLSLVYRFLHKLTSNQISPRLLGGPIEIAKQAGKSAEEGFGRLLLFLTMLSANLAVVNFLPIPVLDGGHMVFLLYEWVRGKPPSEGVVTVLSYVGLALILTLMVFVFGLDLGLIPRR